MPILQLKEKFILESGKYLIDPQIKYHSYGTLNADASNVIWVCHALTANSDVFDWWKGLFGPKSVFNPEEHYIICANFLGSHYGTTGPLSNNPETGEPYFHDFPEVTIRDMVKMHIKLADHLNIGQIQLLIGGSMGGHQALEWSIIQPQRIENLCLLATSAIISPWAAALNHTQRAAIEADTTWRYSHPTAGEKGMGIARSLALLSYRNQTIYNSTQKDNLSDRIYPIRPGSYQDYQGKKLIKRFNAFSYWHTAKAMDSHNISRNRGSFREILASITARTLVISLTGDLLFPYEEQLFLQQGIPGAKHEIISSEYGHDGFLIEVEKIGNLMRAFIGVEVGYN